MNCVLKRLGEGVANNSMVACSNTDSGALWAMVCYLTQTGGGRRRWGQTPCKKWCPNCSWRRCTTSAGKRVGWGEGVDRVLQAKGMACDQRWQRGCAGRVSGSNEGRRYVCTWNSCVDMPKGLWASSSLVASWRPQMDLTWQLISIKCFMDYVLFCFCFMVFWFWFLFLFFKKTMCYQSSKGSPWIY